MLAEINQLKSHVGEKENFEFHKEKWGLWVIDAWVEAKNAHHTQDE